ncbi:hypothetical protein Fuma_05837 [Fuerstiella marisgermanici]|uniref:Uncharacterized protein n=1 Tax=Fuerstiella marisgermanici TaxID=1891926 RepID=A0A1P8WQ40_9PLAN|nr:hypothetical protein Fuma_05837 [Fuerstiella marisgermanici]
MFPLILTLLFLALMLRKCRTVSVCSLPDDWSSIDSDDCTSSVRPAVFAISLSEWLRSLFRPELRVPVRGASMKCALQPTNWSSHDAAVHRHSVPVFNPHWMLSR